jgi:hypothetical protein
MHDWTLISIVFDWKTGKVILSCRNLDSQLVNIVGEKVTDLHVPSVQEWGPSISINEVNGPIDMAGSKQLTIEMQSGDVMTISASSFVIPR